MCSETEPHYLWLSTADLKKGGPWMRFTPPVNVPEEVEQMWPLFDLGYFDTIGTDHCPITKAEKEQGLDNVLDAPCGIPGIDTNLRLMLTGVNEGKTSLNRVVECMCENTAKEYGLYPKKGAIEIGCDADILILDMDKEEVIENEKLYTKCGWSPIAGRTIKGVPKIVFVRGQIVCEDGVVVGKPGYGQWVPRQK